MDIAHQKHAGLAKPALGSFGRNEWAIMGAPCGKIQHLAESIRQAMGNDFSIAYVDADHKQADEDGSNSSTNIHSGDWSMVYSDKIAYHRLDWKGKTDSFAQRTLFNEVDCVLVNGNHFPAKRQIVVVDSAKKESLKRKLDRLTQVDLILLDTPNEAPFDFLMDFLQDAENIPVLPLGASHEIAAFLKEKIKDSLPPLWGLVLAGGKSQRMGTDKGLIEYYGKPQREYMAEVIHGFCEKTFISCRPEQMAEIKSNFSLLPDSFKDLGPFGAILSAFRFNPDAAWLVIACDLPFLDSSTIRQLVQQRDSSKTATAFNSPFDQFPEPLIAVWEPKSYLVLLQFLAQGYSCPRKVLLNKAVHLINPLHPQALQNVNLPEELLAAKQKLTNKG